MIEVSNKVWPNHKIGNRWQNNGDSKAMRIPELRKILLKSFHDKVIPMIYLRASVEQRLELLQGLMDSDSSISTRKGQAIYTSTEKALSDSVSELLWSLGIKNAITEAPSTIRNDMDKPSDKCGRRETGEILYYVKFTVFDDLRITGFKRKQKNAVKRNLRTRSHYRYIESIEKVKNRGM